MLPEAGERRSKLGADVRKESTERVVYGCCQFVIICFFLEKWIYLGSNCWLLLEFSREGDHVTLVVVWPADTEHQTATCVHFE